MSKNLELMRQAGRGITLESPIQAELQATESPAMRPLQPSPRSGEDNTLDWLRLLNILTKHWRWSALFAAVVMGTVIVLTLAMKSVYEPVATIEIDPSGELFSLEGGSSGSDAEYLETQAKNLESEELVRAVVRKVASDRNSKNGRATEPNASQARPAAQEQEMTPLTPEESALLWLLRDGLNVRRDTSSRLIYVSIGAHDPELATVLTNTLVDLFVEETYRTRYDAIVKSSEWLSRQIDDVRARMETSNRVLTDFQRSTFVSDTSGDTSSFSEKMTELGRQLTQAQADRIQLEALLRSVREGNPDSLPEVRSNPVVQQLSAKLAEVRVELAQALVIYGKNHFMAKKLQHQVDELQAQLNEQKAAVVASTRSSYTAARAREQLMTSEIRNATKDLGLMARYAELKREAKTNTDLYNSLYARVKEAGISAASKSSNIRIVDRARVPDAPARPNRPLLLAIGFLAALFGGVMLALVMEQFDTRIHDPEDIRNWIGASNISIVPIIGEGKSRVPELGLGGTRLLAKGTHKAVPDTRFLIDRPTSPEAEALRSLYASIMLSRPGNPPQVLLVISSFPGEGKTTVAANLAMALAQHGDTCILDADLRRGMVARTFGLSSNPGVSDVLTGAMLVQDTLVSDRNLLNLTILPAGSTSPNAGQLICSDKMRDLVQAMRQRFSFVVIDSPPILPFADGRALAPLADGVILVGCSGVTTRQAMLRSIELLAQARGAPILEVVLNRADPTLPGYRYFRYGYSDNDTAASKQ